MKFGNKTLATNGKQREKNSHNGSIKEQHYLQATESAIGHMNYFTNLHLQTVFQDDMTNILSLISPTFDSDVITGLIKLAISSICTSLFPSALSLGIPIMIFLLVLEKEDSVKNLLQVNGLREVDYWISFLLWNFMILSVTTAIFLIAGW